MVADSETRAYGSAQNAHYCCSQNAHWVCVLGTRPFRHIADLAILIIVITIIIYRMLFSNKIFK